MSSPSNEDLKREVETVLQIETGKGRLPNMLQIARLLDGWAERLGETGPAQVQQVVERSDDRATSDD